MTSSKEKSRRGDIMYLYIARANIDHYISILNTDGLLTCDSITIIKLLAAEIDKLCDDLDLEQIEFVESRTASGRDRVNSVQTLRDSYAVGTVEREQADQLLRHLENVQTLLEYSCRRMREKTSSRPLRTP